MSGKKHSELMSPKHDKPPNDDLISIVDCDSTTIITSDQAQQLKTPGFSHMSHSVILVDRSIPDSLVSLSITLKLSLTTYLIIILQANTCSTLTSGTSAIVPRETPLFTKVPGIDSTLTKMANVTPPIH